MDGNMKQVRVLFIWVILFSWTQAHASSFQQSSESNDGTVTGIVTDATSGESLVGVNILVKGTSQGASTDGEGRYQLTVPAENDTLVFSYIGYKTKEVPVMGRSEINVSLQPQALQGEEVVVTGYSTQRKSDLTGAIEAVDMEVTANATSGNPMQSLQGSVPGLFIEKSGSPTGSTNEILIRGVNTLGDNSPLYVIDGVPTKRKQVFENLNPSSIESIQVLKDAASASVYGARASNGVIVVTTKDARAGQLDVKVNYSQSVETEIQRRFDMLDAEGRGRTLWRASVNDGTDPSAAFGEIYNFDWNGDFNDPVLNSVTPREFVGGDTSVPSGDTDWQAETYEPASVSNLDFTVSGGNENSSVLLNLGYLKNTGMLVNTDFERFNGRIKGDTEFYDGTVKVGLNAAGGTSDELLVATDLGGAPTPSLAINLAPTIPVRTKDGRFAGPLGSGYSDRNNPVHMQYIDRFDNTDRSFINGTGYLEVNLMDNLTARSSLGLDFSTIKFKDIQLRFQEGFTQRNVNSLRVNNENFSSLTWTNTIEYSNDFGKHGINVLAGYEQISDDFEKEETFAQDFASQTESFFVLDAASGATTSSGIATESRLQSLFSKIDYNFDDKYLLAFTFRRDGSSRFGENNQYGIFPSLSAGWRINQESFMQDIDFLSNLKLRAGVSRVGNQQIGDFAALALYQPRYGPVATEVGRGGFFEQFWNVGTAYDLNGDNTGSLPSGFVQTQAANPNLKWETTEELNVGLDLGAFNQRLTATFDYFTRKTEDILIRPPIASAVGEGQERFINGATIESNGWELTLGYNKSINRDLNVAITTNLSHFDDKITKLPESVRTAFAGNAEKDILGQSSRDIFGYVADGIFNNQEEVQAHASQTGAAPGRIRYKDLNGDGAINSLDQKFIGSGLPSLEYGIRLNVNYKNFDFTLFGSGVEGRKGFSDAQFIQSLMRGRENGGTNLLNAWTPDNRDADIPALTLADNNNETRPSTFFLISTDYFKLRNLEIGYTLQNEFTNQFSDKIRFFAKAEEFLTLTDEEFIGPDPERGNIGQIPIPTTFTLGVNLDL